MLFTPAPFCTKKLARLKRLNACALSTTACSPCNRISRAKPKSTSTIHGPRKEFSPSVGLGPAEPIPSAELIVEISVALSFKAAPGPSQLLNDSVELVQGVL